VSKEIRLKEEDYGKKELLYTQGKKDKIIGFINLLVELMEKKNHKIWQVSRTKRRYNRVLHFFILKYHFT
jgi:hypothetical protein